VFGDGAGGLLVIFSKPRLYRVATACILVGLAMLCQPFSIDVFSAGFPTLLAGVLLFAVLDHLGSGGN
jgi:hypothetical protein